MLLESISLSREPWYQMTRPALESDEKCYNIQNSFFFFLCNPVLGKWAQIASNCGLHFAPREGLRAIPGNAIFSRTGINFVGMNKFMQWIHARGTERRNGPCALWSQRVELETPCQPPLSCPGLSRVCPQVEPEESRTTWMHRLSRQEPQAPPSTD